MGLPFWACSYNNIYIWFKPPPSLESCLDLSELDYTEGRPPDLAGPPPDLVGRFLFLKFWLRALIGNFPTATWQPMTGPCGSQPLAEPGTVTAYVSLPCVARLLAHVSAYDRTTWLLLGGAMWCITWGCHVSHFHWPIWCTQSAKSTCHVAHCHWAMSAC
jgi:hypothetical protein